MVAQFCTSLTGADDGDEQEDCDRERDDGDNYDDNEDDDSVGNWDEVSFADKKDDNNQNHYHYQQQYHL